MSKSVVIPLFACVCVIVCVYIYYIYASSWYGCLYLYIRHMGVCALCLQGCMCTVRIPVCVSGCVSIPTSHRRTMVLHALPNLHQTPITPYTPITSHAERDTKLLVIKPEFVTMHGLIPVPCAWFLNHAGTSCIVVTGVQRSEVRYFFGYRDVTLGDRDTRLCYRGMTSFPALV